VPVHGRHTRCRSESASGCGEHRGAAQHLGADSSKSKNLQRREYRGGSVAEVAVPAAAASISAAASALPSPSRTAAADAVQLKPGVRHLPVAGLRTRASTSAVRACTDAPLPTCPAVAAAPRVCYSTVQQNMSVGVMSQVAIQAGPLLQASESGCSILDRVSVAALRSRPHAVYF
jgi:hypothetical protein